MHVAAVHAPGGELPDLEEGRAGIEQPLHALARQHLAAADVLLARGVVAALRDRLYFAFQIRNQILHARGVRLEFGRAHVELAPDRAHASSARLRPITMRWMSFAPS